jgi:hypothetical protein
MGRTADYVRRHPGTIIVVAAASLVIVGGFARSGDSADDDGPADTTEQAEAATETDEADGLQDDGPTAESADANGSGVDPAAPDATPGSEGTSEEAASTSNLPTDVAHPRPTVELDRPPDGSDPAEVARWWTAVYTSYVGAEPGRDLAERLEEHTTPDLQAELEAVRPPASYGTPVDIDGASSGGPFVNEQQNAADERTVRVTVESLGTVVVYDVALIATDGRWQVDGVEAL